MLEWIAAHEWTLIGVIFMLVIGPAVGNYACSVVYRLPRGKTPFERHPFCGHCSADLKPIDLFPILSWVMTRGKCRYCSGAFPSIYTVIEFLSGAAFVAYFLNFGMSEPFLLYALYATFIIIVAAIEWQQGWIAATPYSYAISALLLVRVLSEHTIFPAVQGGFLMLILSIIIAQIRYGKTMKPFEVTDIWWWVALGAAVPIPQWKLLLPVLILSTIVPRATRVMVYTTGALIVPVVIS